MPRHVSVVLTKIVLTFATTDLFNRNALFARMRVHKFQSCSLCFPGPACGPEATWAMKFFFTELSY